MCQLGKSHSTLQNGASAVNLGLESGNMLPLPVAYQKLSEDDVGVVAFVANRGHNQNRLEKPKKKDWSMEESSAAAAPVSDVDRSIDRLQSDRLLSPSSLYGALQPSPS